MTRLLKWLLAVALVAAFLLPIPARPGPVCYSVEAVEKSTIERFPGSEVFVRLVGRKAKEFMDFFNAAPPVTDYEGDEIIGFRRYGDPNLLFVIFVDGCRTGRAVMSPTQYRRFRTDFELMEEEPA